MKNLSIIVSVMCAGIFEAQSQILLSKGTNYVQNFDSLVGKTNVPWADNLTLPGWYAASKAKGAYKNYRVSNGEDKSNGLYSFGSTATNPNDRALGSIASSSPAVIGYGVRFKNDTANSIAKVAVSYTGEQWRNSTPNASEQVLSFSYKASSSPLTGPEPGVTDGWKALTALDFTRLQHGEAGPLDGNAADNRTKKSNVSLTGLSLKPGEGLFLRWIDADDEGQNDHGLAIDDLTVSFTPASDAASKP